MLENKYYRNTGFFDNELTAAHDVTSPIISIPASARAVLAATDPEATHPSIPSVSMTVIKISIVDFGNISNRTDEASDWCMATAMDLSSASYQLYMSRSPSNGCEQAYPHGCSPATTWKWCKLDFYIQSPFFVVCRVFRLTRTVAICRTGLLKHPNRTC